MADSKSPEKTNAEESFLSQSNSDAQGQLTAAVDELLDQLQGKFDKVSKEMFGKLDDMTRRLDELEASLTASSAESPSAPPPAAPST
ncbi:hypothetical protein POX_d05335 [Penicillium oxalicum]|uniref:Heat shock factor binding protein n=1 Tax=Penicillium oxalicum (strain 114-2 / CGMCC 5302) TaxID=933388 RepID=S7ZP80_PENO1|nr:hypothetical protein POX_d05335 [Penicillium oxalicum]EPS32505.1 hypothetical protein PDE_07465 [Penicillium oxalicum 114-2]KAI2789837.1 hypothetical protein POX_d05335 [Penicillium oxalicum]